MGRSRKGLKAIQITPLQRRANVSVYLVVEKTHGYIYQSVQTRPFKSQDFEEFLEVLANINESLQLTNVLLVMDNALIHLYNDVKDIRDLYDFFYLFNPYSPILKSLKKLSMALKIELKPF